jgi:hypothetical protein
MSTAELRRSIKKKVDALAPERLQSAADFLAFLSDPASDRTFEEYLRNRPPLEERLRQAEKDITAGRLTPIEQLRRKY